MTRIRRCSSRTGNLGNNCVRSPFYTRCTTSNSEPSRSPRISQRYAQFYNSDTTWSSCSVSSHYCSSRTCRRNLPSFSGIRYTSSNCRTSGRCLSGPVQSSPSIPGLSFGQCQANRLQTHPALYQRTRGVQAVFFSSIVSEYL